MTVALLKDWSIGLCSVQGHGSSRIDLCLAGFCISLLSRWCGNVEEYTQRKLTLGKDKLPALSRLAKYIATRTQDSTTEDYIAGMWSESLKTDLLWEST